MEPAPETSQLDERTRDSARGRGLRLAAVIGGPSFAVVLVFTGALIAFANRGPARQSLLPLVHATAPARATLSATTAATASATAPTPTAIPGTPTPTPQPIFVTAGGGGQQPQPTAVPTDGPLTLTGASITASLPTYSKDACPDSFGVTFTIRVSFTPGNGAGILDLSWTTPPPFSLTSTWSAYVTSREPTYSIQMPYDAGLGTGETLHDRFTLSTSNGDLPTSHASFAFTCVRHVVSAHVSFNADSWNAPCTSDGTLIDGHTFLWTITITLTPGPATSISFQRVDAIYVYAFPLLPQPYPVAAGQNTVTYGGAAGLFLSAPNGTYGMSVAVTDPVNLTSPEATVTKNC